MARNARHRKGFRLGQVSLTFIEGGVDEEYREFRHALLKYISGEEADTSHILSELGDLLGCLFHFSLAIGFTQEQVTEAMLDKFRNRFDEREKHESEEGPKAA